MCAMCWWGVLQLFVLQRGSVLKVGADNFYHFLIHLPFKYYHK
jgi:hypothetical protein